VIDAVGWMQIFENRGEDNGSDDLFSRHGAHERLQRTVCRCVGTGTDAVSGVATTGNKLQRAEVSFANDTDGTGTPSWTFIDLVTDPTSPYNDTTVVKGKSYKYQYVVNDNVNNSSTWTSANIARMGIRVTSPNGGNTWTFGTTMTPAVTWTGVNNTVIPNVKITLSTDGGITWTPDVNNPIAFVLTTSTPNNGSFTYLINTMGEDVSDTCKIKIEDATNPAIYDISNTNFKIVGTLSLDVPQNGVEWTMGTAQTIHWFSSGQIGNVKVSYSTNSGNAGSYTNIIWTSIPWALLPVRRGQ